jgi:hypothetical protein
MAPEAALNCSPESEYKWTTFPELISYRETMEGAVFESLDACLRNEKEDGCLEK